MEVSVLRELFRNLQLWQSLHEAGGTDILVGPDQQAYCLWDITYLNEEVVPTLSKRQREAIQLHLVDNMKESDAAQQMGIAPTNPVGIYATAGLRKIVAKINNGEIPRFKESA